MALIEWHKNAWRLFNEHVDYAHHEFGKKTGDRWLKEMASIDSRLRLFPESFTPEPLLKDRCNAYRFCHIMKRFKIIYYYEDSVDTVHIVDIWDTMQNPATLIHRID